MARKEPAQSIEPCAAAKRHPDRERGQRHVDPEHGSPVEEVDQEAADRRAERGGRRGRRRPGADCLAADFAREASGDDREALRHQQRRPDSLNDPRADENANVRRDGASDRRNSKQRNAYEEDPPPAIEIAEPAGDKDKGAEHQRVAIDHPLNRLEIGIEAALDRRQGNRHHRTVDECQGRGEDRRAKHEPPQPRAGIHAGNVRHGGRRLETNTRKASSLR
jgi:hypothetical protein